MYALIGNKIRTPAPSTDLGLLIFNHRINNQKSLRALASECGLSVSYLCDLENGRGKNPSMDALKKLSAVGIKVQL